MRKYVQVWESGKVFSMEFQELHPWNLDLEEATALQCRLRERLILESPGRGFSRVAGADVSYEKEQGLAYAAVLVFRLPELELLEQVVAHQEVDFPYIPGFLSFREAPALLRAFRRLQTEPEVILIDGQGIAHPRGLGLASHVGLILDRPTIGCAKSRLVGLHREVEETPGASSPLLYQGKVVGAALRTRKATRPLYISPGHRMDLPTALQVILQTCRGYRLPEPVRQAHLLVTEAKRRGD